MADVRYPFTEAEAKAAYDDWGCNCGPTALAFALQTTLDVVRTAIPDFDSRRYTSPTMMSEALSRLGRQVNPLRAPGKFHGKRDRLVGHADMFRGPMSLVRIQWTGPWTKEGASGKWAARQTHWIACWIENEQRQVFDVNGGIRNFHSWEQEIVPLIVAQVPRADGGWFPANVWQLLPTKGPTND